ncbi:hypothetical protein [Roseovarius sp. THAF9]|uniref:hypothetical protein n=1 Tax=Roseovarius sp. THAF9 TaxID=2587847 RepID=UPI0012680261|nr:hypothetical protein [Roseovarius sp. THAF9]
MTSIPDAAIKPRASITGPITFYWDSVKSGGGEACHAQALHSGRELPMQDVSGENIRFEPTRPEVAEGDRPVENGAA